MGERLANDPMERRVSDLAVDMAELRSDLKNHILICDRRAQHLVWLVRFVAAAVATVLGILLKSQLNIGG